MKGLVVERIEISEEHIEQQLIFLDDEFRYRSMRGHGHGEPPDLRIEACAQAGADQLQNPAAREHYKQAFLFRLNKGETWTPSTALSTYVRSVQKIFLPFAEELNYPEEHTTKEKWISSMKEVFGDRETGEAAREEFATDMYIRRIQSNISERYKAIKLILHLNEERFGDKPRVLDIGCSQNHGLKQIDLDFPFEPIQPGANAGSSTQVEAYTDEINRLIATDRSLGESVGTDFFSFRDPKIKEWAKSCSFYPSELLDKHKVRIYDELDNAAADNVGFHEADFTDASEIAPLQKLDKFDIATCSTMLYQLTPDKRQQVLINAESLLKNNGLIVVQDFVDVDPNNPHALVFPEQSNRKPFEYVTLIKDLAEPEKGFQEFARWNNGRCQQIEINPDALLVQAINKYGRVRE